MKQREIVVHGFKVEVCDFGYAQFYYPAFNGNAEFKVNRNGFKKLRRYLGMIKWINKNLEIDRAAGLALKRLLVCRWLHH